MPVDIEVYVISDFVLCFDVDITAHFGILIPIFTEFISFTL